MQGGEVWVMVGMMACEKLSCGSFCHQVFGKGLVTQGTKCVIFIFGMGAVICLAVAPFKTGSLQVVGNAHRHVLPITLHHWGWGAPTISNPSLNLSLVTPVSNSSKWEDMFKLHN